METTQTTEVFSVTEPALQEPNLENSAHFSKGIKAGALVTLIVLISVGSYFAGKMNNGSPEQTPTPTPIVTVTSTPTPIETVLPTPSETEEPTVSPTVTGTPTPSATVVTTTRKAFKLIYGSSIHSTQEFILGIRSDVKATVVSLNYVYNAAIVLQKDNKNFMLIANPSQNTSGFLDQQGYSSAKLVPSVNMSKLYRVHAKKIFKSSGAYDFAIAYATQDSLASGDSCTFGYGVYDKTTSPCALSLATYSKGVASTYGVAAYCTIDPAYIPLCDEVMRTFEMKDTVGENYGYEN